MHGYAVFAKVNGQIAVPDLVIVDTDVLIDAGRDIADAVTCLEQVEQQASLAIRWSVKWNWLSGAATRQNCAHSTDFYRAFR